MLSHLSNPDVLSALLNSWGTLTKMRPSTVQFVVTALKQWSPGALANLSMASIKSVEKALRILLVHISRFVQSVDNSPSNVSLTRRSI
jgi:symplekin